MEKTSILVVPITDFKSMSKYVLKKYHMTEKLKKSVKQSMKFTYPFNKAEKIKAIYIRFI